MSICVGPAAWVRGNAREMSGFGLCPELLGGGHVK
jgi:hypothetical protein